MQFGEYIGSESHPQLSGVAGLLRRARARYPNGCLELTETYPIFEDLHISQTMELAELARYYPDTAGEPALRESIADYIHQTCAQSVVSPEAILVTQGASHALFVVFQALRRRITAISFPVPSFVGYRQIALTLGLPVLEHEAPTAQWSPAAAFANCPRKSLVLINTPHNPTGYVPSEAQLTQVLEVAREKELFVVFDLVYDGYIFEGDRDSAIPYSACQRFPGVPTFFINSMSKNMGQPGLRVGWINAPLEFIPEFEVAIEVSVNCVSPITQHLAAQLLSTWPTEKCRQLVRTRLQRMVSHLRDCRELQFQVPAGGTVLWIRMEPRLATLLLEWLLDQHAIVLLPGFSYAGGTDGFFRLSFGYPERVTDRVCAHIKEFLTGRDSL